MPNWIINSLKKIDKPFIAFDDTADDNQYQNHHIFEQDRLEQMI